MTDQSPPTVPMPLPTFAQTIVTDLAQKGLTIVAVSLTAHGLLGQAGQAQFVEDGSGLALLVLGIVWTWLHAQHKVALTKAALNAPAPQ